MEGKRVPNIEAIEELRSSNAKTGRSGSKPGFMPLVLAN